MERVFFPCLINGPDANGWFVVCIPGPNVNAQEKSEEGAMVEAAELLQHFIDTASPDTPVEPGSLEEFREPDDRIGVIQAVRAAVPA